MGSLRHEATRLQATVITSRHYFRLQRPIRARGRHMSCEGFSGDFDANGLSEHGDGVGMVG